jgi:hypothetical protein
MSRVIEIFIGALAVVGAAFGLIGLVPGLLQGALYGSIAEALTMLSTLLYSVGIWSAVGAFRSRAGWVRPASWFWLAQVPMLQSSLASWAMFSGMGVWTYLRLSPGKIGAGVSWFLGGGHRWSVSVVQPTLVVGVNLVALAVTFALFRFAPDERHNAGAPYA